MLMEALADLTSRSFSCSPTELAQARSELSSVSDVFRQVRSLRSSPELLETVPAMQLDPLVQRVKIEQGQAQRQLDELLNRYGSRHPKVVDAKVSAQHAKCYT